MKRLMQVLLISFILFSGNTVYGVGQSGLVDMRIMETTDLHGNIVDYDYVENKKTVEFGLARTATLIKQARKEVPNTLLFDDGDLLQGNLLAEYVALIDRFRTEPVHPMIKVMNDLRYDAATLGNHDFHYGLDFLYRTISDAKFPFVNANMYFNDHQPYNFNAINMFKPYVILNKKVIDRNGKKHLIKVGVIGFVTPAVVKWEKKGLAGMAKVMDIVDSAEAFVPKMKAEGADIIIALAHTGFDATAKAYEKAMNAVYPLSFVPGIDVILFGHQHKVFPDKSKLKGIAGVDTDTGTINGVPAVEAGSWGNYLGMVDLTLQNTNGLWSIVHSKSIVKPIFKIEKGKIKPLVKADQKILNEVKEIHEKTMQYSRRISHTKVD
ncbi:metallophosphoesterase [Heyndrickxia sp. NPDC080065]|uniref:metallophosphoesterase n=1 Tax=Heyndrickxia sp. NPDC080065 TaxID=3390568 RepID=UPI003CFD9FF3